MENNINYEYVNMDDVFMRMAYDIAKTLYRKTEWNIKTTPVAVIVKDDIFIAAGIAGKGNHVLNKWCDRVKSVGTSYDNCKWCHEDVHAEKIALKDAYKEDLTGAIMYLYGHYHFCDSCMREMQERGITRFLLLENSNILFNRHKKGTLINTKKQFIM